VVDRDAAGEDHLEAEPGFFERLSLAPEVVAGLEAAKRAVRRHPPELTVGCAGKHAVLSETIEDVGRRGFGAHGGVG
jgi:hypothetical protein